MDASQTRGFQKNNQIVSHDTLSTYTDFNETFKIHTDAIPFQLGAVIIQEGKPIASYGRTLTDDQQLYTVKETELLSIVETMHEFWTILTGQKLRIYTDHEKLTCKKFDTDRGLR